MKDLEKRLSELELILQSKLRRDDEEREIQLLAESDLPITRKLVIAHEKGWIDIVQILIDANLPKPE